MNILRKWLPGIIAFLIATVLGLQFVFYFFGDRILRKSLLVGFSQYIYLAYPEAKHLPSLDFETLSINLLSGNVSFSQVAYQAAYPLENEVAVSHVKITVPKITLKGISFWKLYRHREINVRSIRLLQPSIKFQQSSTSGEGQQEVDQFNDFKRMADQFFNDRLSSIHCGRLTIERAHLAYTFADRPFLVNDTVVAPQQVVEELSLEMLNLHLDTAAFSKTTDPHIAQIRMHLRNYRAVLPDSSYRLGIGSVSYSNTDKKMLLKDMVLVPENINKPASTADQYFSCHIPHVELTHFSPAQLMAGKTLQLNNVLMQQPAMQVYGHFDRKHTDHISGPGLRKLSADSLYSHIQPYLRLVAIRNFKLQQGNLQVHDISQQQVLLSANKLNLGFEDFVLKPPSSQSDTNYIFPAKHIALSAADVRMNTPDKLHYVVSKSVTVATDAASRYCHIAFDTVQVKPTNGSLSKFLSVSPMPVALGFDIAINRVAFRSLDLEALAMRKEVMVDSLLVAAPRVRIANFSGQPFGELAARLPGGDTALHKSLKEILYDWSHARLDLHPVIAPGRSTALFYGLHANAIHIGDGQCYFYRPARSGSALKQVGALKSVQADFQQVGIGNKEYKAQPQQSQGDHTVAVYAKSFNLRVQRGILYLPDDDGPTSGGTVRFDEAFFSTDQAEGYVRQLRVWPDSTTTVASRTRLSSITIPYAKVSGIDFDRFYKDQYGDVHYLQIADPEIVIAIDDRQQAASKASQRGLDLSVTNLYQWIAPYLNAVSLQRLAIRGANLTVKKNKHAADYYNFLHLPSVDLSVDNFYIDASTRISSAKPFYAKDVNILAKDFEMQIVTATSDGPVVLLGKSADFSSDHHVHLNKLSIRSTNTRKQIYYQAAIRKVDIAFDDLYGYLKHNKLELNQLTIQAPALTLKKQLDTTSNPGEAPEKPKIGQPDLYPYLEGIADELTIHRTNVQQGSFSLMTYNTDTLGYLRADTIEVQANEIVINKSSRLVEKPGYAKEVSFYVHVTHGFQRIDSTARLQIDRATVSSNDRQIKIGTLQLIQGENSYGKLQLTTAAVIDAIDYQQLLAGKITADQLTFVHPEVVLTLDHVPPSVALPKKPVTIRMPALISNLHIHQVSASNGTLTAYRGSDTITLKNIHARADDVVVNSELLSERNDAALASVNISRNLLFADNLTLEIDQYYQENNLTRMEAENVRLSTKNRQLKVAGLHYQPKYDRKQLKLHHPYQKTWADIHIPEMVFDDMNLDALLHQKLLKIGKATLLNPSIDLYKDKSLEADNPTRKPMPQDLLKQVKFPFIIDTIQLVDGLISYEEQMPDIRESGKITAQQFNATIRGMSNDTASYHQNGLMTIDANAYLLGKSPVSMSLHFYLNSPEGIFSASGKMGQLDLTQFNAMLEPVSSLHVNSGWLQQMNFQFIGNQYTTSGIMNCYYSDLHVRLIDKRRRTFGLDEKVGSFLANTFVIRADNPTNKAFRIGKISYERDATRGISNYVWKSLLSGIKSSVGLVKKADKTKHPFGQKE